MALSFPHVVIVMFPTSFPVDMTATTGNFWTSTSVTPTVARRPISEGPMWVPLASTHSPRLMSWPIGLRWEEKESEKGETFLKVTKAASFHCVFLELVPTTQETNRHDVPTWCLALDEPVLGFAPPTPLCPKRNQQVHQGESAVFFFPVDGFRREKWDSRPQTLGATRCLRPGPQHQRRRGWERPSSPSSPGPASLCGLAACTQPQMTKSCHQNDNPETQWDQREHGMVFLKEAGAAAIAYFCHPTIYWWFPLIWSRLVDYGRAEK